MPAQIQLKTVKTVEIEPESDVPSGAVTLTVPKRLAPPTGVILYLPPAWPHGSTTGALPGARQGLWRYESSSAPGVAWMFMVQYAFGRTAAVEGLKPQFGHNVGLQASIGIQ